MPVRKIFTDGSNDLEAYINDKGKLFISVGVKNADNDDPYNQGCIELDRSDLDAFLDLLMELKEGVFNDSDFEDKTAEAKTA
jgi:hypothetical protein